MKNNNFFKPKKISKKAGIFFFFFYISANLCNVWLNRGGFLYLPQLFTHCDIPHVL